MTEPVDPETADHEDLVERAADVTDDLERPTPIEADEADVADQHRDIPVDDEDDYPA